MPLFKPKKGTERPNLELVNRLRDDELPTQAARVSKRHKLDPMKVGILRTGDVGQTLANAFIAPATLLEPLRRLPHARVPATEKVT